MAKALGIKFLDEKKNELGPGGGALAKLKTIDMAGLDPRINDSTFLVACDVNNKLTGPEGASHVYGPQKGANPEMVKNLDTNLKHFQQIIKEQLGKDVSQLPGGGAAGGLGAGLYIFLNAELKPGFEIISRTAKLEESIQQCDLIITGEGKLDDQTQYGKTPFGVASLAKKHNKKVIALAGTLGKGYQENYQWMDVIMPITPGPVDLPTALANAESYLSETAERLFRALQLNAKK